MVEMKIIEGGRKPEDSKSSAWKGLVERLVGGLKKILVIRIQPSAVELEGLRTGKLKQISTEFGSVMDLLDEEQPFTLDGRPRKTREPSNLRRIHSTMGEE